MKGVTFGAYHSFRDLHLILTEKEIASPTTKVKKLDVEGTSSSIDYTDYFGEPTYDDMVHRFKFSTIVPKSEFPSLFSSVKNAIHGKKMRVILDDDLHFYYVGRPSVHSFTSEKSVGLIDVDVDCEPWKYKLHQTSVSIPVNGTDTIVLTNSRKRVVPEVKIETENSIRIEYQNSNIWDLGRGSYTLPELELEEGENPVTITGVGTITFTYQEASL